ncbi:hypothetical protein CDV31_009319 [Fusarium ambrosium]|uniref:Uncharacterized protein n=1 Tax=Fusarium ambrosium TaxID=131363 RepID=A0A428TVC8_9HYPO|nr:hypothetical protein CDV31_009319 [Fusarium ambrosium]
MDSNTAQCFACSGVPSISQWILCSECSGTGATWTLVACASCAASGGNAYGCRCDSGRLPGLTACSTCSGNGGHTSTLSCPACSRRPLRRSPTDSSYVTFGGQPNLDEGENINVGTSTWMYARDVRAQVANAPKPIGRRQRPHRQSPHYQKLPRQRPHRQNPCQSPCQRPHPKPCWRPRQRPLQRPNQVVYPSYFGNRELLSLQASAPIQHIPLIPGQKTTHTVNEDAGRWRAFYNDNNRQIIDVGYHDPNAGRTKSGNYEFTLGHFYSQNVDSEADACEQNMELDGSKAGDDIEDPNSTEDQSMSDL